MTPLTIRRTALEALSVCPAWEGDGGLSARFGRDVHSAIEAWTRACVDAGGWIEPKRDMVPRGDREVFEVLTQFSFGHDPQVEVWDSSEELLSVDVGDGVTLTGTLDRLDLWPIGGVGGEGVGARIVDYKTGWAAPTETSFQLRFYGALLCFNNDDVREVTLVQDHVRLSADRGILSEVLTRDELMVWWVTDVEPLIPLAVSALREGGEPQGGSACTWCRKRWTCAEGIAPARDVPTSDDEAREILAEMVRLDAAKDARVKALRAFMDGREPIQAAGWVMGFQMTGEGMAVDTVAAKAAGLVKPKVPKRTWACKPVKATAEDEPEAVEVAS